MVVIHAYSHAWVVLVNTIRAAHRVAAKLAPANIKDGSIRTQAQNAGAIRVKKLGVKLHGAQICIIQHVSFNQNPGAW